MDVDTDELENTARPTVRTSKLTIINMKETEYREINFNDRHETLFRFITSHFYTRERLRTIQSVDIVVNEKLEKAFECKQKEFKSRNIPDRPILAYHGTPPSNFVNIITNNFDKSKLRRQFHGYGHYFSESPALALPYSYTQTDLIMVKILPGRQYKGPHRVWPQYDSKLVFPDLHNFSQILVVAEKDQILPCAIIHLNVPDFQIPRLYPMPLSLASQRNTTPSTTNQLVTSSQPYPKFNPNIIFPIMRTSMSGSSLPKVSKPTGNQVLSIGNTVMSSPSSLPVYTRNFLPNGRESQENNSTQSASNENRISREHRQLSTMSVGDRGNQQSYSTQPQMHGSRSSRVGVQLGSIAEAVFKPILKKRNAKKEDSN